MVAKAVESRRVVASRSADSGQGALKVSRVKRVRLGKGSLVVVISDEGSRPGADAREVTDDPSRSAAKRRRVSRRVVTRRRVSRLGANRRRVAVHPSRVIVAVVVVVVVVAGEVSARCLERTAEARFQTRVSRMVKSVAASLHLRRLALLPRSVRYRLDERSAKTLDRWRQLLPVTLTAMTTMQPGTSVACDRSQS